MKNFQNNQAKNCLINSEIVEGQMNETFYDKIEVLRLILPEKDLSEETLKPYKLGSFLEDSFYDVDKILLELCTQEERELFSSKVGTPSSFDQGESKGFIVEEVINSEGDFYQYLLTTDGIYFKVKNNRDIESGSKIVAFMIPAEVYLAGRHRINKGDGHEMIWLTCYHFTAKDFYYISEIKTPLQLKKEQKIEEIKRSLTLHTE